ncbi:MAG: SCO family protein [Ignavibacteriales bacterium]|nr:MAG: SCO family protein [Ignavibacteriales bacterium]
MKQLVRIALLILFFTLGCNNPLPKEENINKSFTLINQDSSKVIFPDDFKGKIIVTGFIFTNCPDICPMTIHNMQLIQKKVKDEKISDVEFTAISFDPSRDKPSILKQQAEVREVDLTNFSFLTGNKKEIDSLLYEMNINAFTGDTTYTESGTPVYFFVHTDRITLIDQQGRIRKEYTGSRIVVDEILSDIKFLGE